MLFIMTYFYEYCKTLKFGGSKFWWFLRVDLLVNLYFGRFLSSEKQSVISDVALCVLCMRVLHGDLQVINGGFQLFSTLYCWCVSQYKSVLMLFYYS